MSASLFPSEMESDGARYELGRLLGTGNTGAVYLAVDRETGEPYVDGVTIKLIDAVDGSVDDSAVTGGGFAGFMLGTTANAMANMGVLVEKYGPAPRAYLVVPMVGAFFIDFTNALIITAFLNVLR